MTVVLVLGVLDMGRIGFGFLAMTKKEMKRRKSVRKDGKQNNIPRIFRDTTKRTSETHLSSAII